MGKSELGEQRKRPWIRRGQRERESKREKSSILRDGWSSTWTTSGTYSHDTLWWYDKTHGERKGIRESHQSAINLSSRLYFTVQCKINSALSPWSSWNRCWLLITSLVYILFSFLTFHPPYSQVRVIVFTISRVTNTQLLDQTRCVYIYTVCVCVVYVKQPMVTICLSSSPVPRVAPLAGDFIARATTHIASSPKSPRRLRPHLFSSNRLSATREGGRQKWELYVHKQTIVQSSPPFCLKTVKK